jgi:tetratricopeptide (TPR) repeat protein
MRATAAILLTMLLGAGLAAGCGRTFEREVATGVRAMHRGRYVEARARFEKAISQRPGAEDNALVYEYLGHACWRLSDIEAAAAAFQESRRLDPGNWRASYNLGAIYASAGDAVRAAALFEEAAMAAPDIVVPLEYLAHLHLAAGRWKEARRTMAEALTREPRSPRLLTRMAMAELHVEGPEAAIARLMAALEIEPNYPPALFNLFAIHAYRLERRSEAVAHGRRFLAAAIHHPQAAVVKAYLAQARPVSTPTPPPSAPPQRSGEDWFARAKQLSDRGDASSIVKVCLAAAESARAAGNMVECERALKTATELAFDVAAGHAALGQYRLEQGRVEPALQSLKQAVVLGDDSEKTLLAMADAAERAGELDAALVALRRAARHPRAGAESQWRLAEFLDRTLHSPADAVREYRLFLSRFPGDPRVLRARERIEALTPATVSGPGAPTPSNESAEPSRAQAPSDTPSVAPAAIPSRRLEWRAPAVRHPEAAAQAYNRAAEYARSGDRERAIFFFTRAIENDDTLAEAFLGLGALYLENDDAELAKDAYRLALERRPDDPVSLYNLALAHYALKETEAAMAAAERALRRQPEFAAAHYLMGTLLADDPARQAEARAHFERFLTLAPNDPNAEAVRRWLSRWR